MYKQCMRFQKTSRGLVEMKKSRDGLINALISHSVYSVYFLT